MVTENPPAPRAPKPKMLAKLEGKVFLPDKDVVFKHVLRKPSLLMGRSDQNSTATNPFKPAKEGVNVGLGVSNKLSRAHARIELDPDTKRFYIHCLGRNGLTVTKPDDDATEIRLTPQSKPLLLASRSVIKLADCVLVFTLPAEMARHVPTSDNPKKRKRRAWIKAEYIALRAHMMRLGYGRWEDIIASTHGRLSERQPSELVPVAREFVAKCYVHARPGVEQKALMEILREDPVGRDLSEDEVVKEVEQLVEEAKAKSQPDEKRKFVRWARKLRLLSRLRDVHDHPSLERLRVGELRVFTPPPALYWTSADDADLILGSYKNGYGMTEPIRNDPELGFHGRYSKPVVVKKSGTPTKTSKMADTTHGSEEDDDDDEDADEDEDERHSNMNDDMDEENGLDSASHHPRKRLKLGERSSKKDDMKGEDSVDHALDDSDISPERTPDNKMDDDSEKNSDKESPLASATEKPKKKIVRLVPKRGPRIGNEDGFNDPEDARLARERMADENGLVPFPSSESLMRRLKSIINSCAKEFDRDQREFKKKKLAASRAKQRKDDLAARKAEKEAEKTRQRAERRIAKSQPFSKKEAVEFERTLANFGVDYKADGKSVDWQWFHSKVDGFDQKYDDTLDAAYVELLGEAHRISDLAAAKEDEDYERVDRINDAKKASTVFSTLTLERAERLIERLQFFRVLRGEVLTHKKINSILRGFKKTRDLPLWWKSCHDRSLLLGVDRHGLNGWDFMAVDNELQFAASMKAWQRKNGNDLKSLKRAAMPKASSGIKRACALVRYFRSRANDPHFEQYTRDEEVRAAPVEAVSEGSSAVKEEKPVVKVEVVEEKPKVALLRRGSEDRGKLKRKADALYPSAPTGRPRTLRPTIVDIPQQDDGQLRLPADLGDGLYLLNLGEVRVNVPGFCRNGIIYPVGFKTVRRISNLVFLNEIFDSEDGQNPVFRVSLLEGFDPDANNVEELWTKVRVVGWSRNIFALWLRVVNQFTKDSEDERIALSSGPERFGLYESTIVYHIQCLPGAKTVKGFEIRDFSRRGEGRKIEPTIGIVRGMLKAIQSKLEKPDAIENTEDVMTGAHDGPRRRLFIANESEMSVPEDWIQSYGGLSQKKKSRRKSSSYWG